MKEFTGWHMYQTMNSSVRILDYAAEVFREKIAFCDNDGDISFEKLKNEAQNVGTYLIKNTAASKYRPIVVYMPKSIKSIVSFMGIMYAGAPYVPIDYATPAARLKKIIENLKPAAIITDSAGKNKALEVDAIDFMNAVSEKADVPLIETTLSNICDLDPAYIMYTSGSTGTPKGVTISHRAVIDYTLWLFKTFDINENSIIGMQSAFHFDNSVFDMFITMYVGAKTYIIPEILFMYPEKLMDYLSDNEISVIFWVPTVMITTANSGATEKASALPPLKLILFAGEVMPITQLNVWRNAFPDARFVNMYGPTEACDIATYYTVDREYEKHETLPIGKPCANMKTLILNDDGKPCATNEQGELYLGGSGIAMGYWNEPEMTSRVFVQNPLNHYYHEKLYKTGDLVYKNDEGNIIFIGRADTQIKLRGNRIELGELESAASAVEQVKSVCALFDDRKQEIVLFVETKSEIVPRKFKLELKKYIPAYMLPGRIITMDAFPHTPTGKIDRVKLRKQYIESPV